MSGHAPLKVWIPSSVAGACLLALSLLPGAHGQEPPKINGHAIDPEQYRLLIKHGFLPTRTTFFSNEDIARKFDLSLPQMAAIKAALDKHDAAALQQALIAYLKSKLPPLKPANPPKP